ncbi:hypothetical protein [Ahrensia sp. R2A130]|uniref:hypothetical protein n=1 Tax=Ahrensia sp. R2A130 TaxID=744979 RepID=UPI0001E0C9B8|nr:hypothetical protein [Ahrensia sp. R2A130]EFL90825.1 Ligand-binding protein [Ahrensia sp. R2A130]
MHALKQEQFCTDITPAQAFLASDPASVACDVMDMWTEDGTLIVISADALPSATLQGLQNCWLNGDVEAYRAMDMMG